MINNLWEKFRRWKQNVEKNRRLKRRLNKLHNLSEILAEGEILKALKSWEDTGAMAAYMNQKRNEKLEIVQTGYVYIFQAANILRPEELEEEEQRIKEGLAAGVLVMDARARLVEVKPRLEARVK